MLTWFTSQNGAIALSFIALLSFIAYAFLESLFFLGQWISGVSAAAVMTLVVIAVVGGWMWGLFTFMGGDQRGLIAMLVFGLLPVLFTLYDLIFYSPIPYGWPLLQIMVWVTFISCSFAVVSVVLQLRQVTD